MMDCWTATCNVGWQILKRCVWQWYFIVDFFLCSFFFSHLMVWHGCWNVIWSVRPLWIINQVQQRKWKDVGCTVCFNSGRDTYVSLCYCVQTICRAVLVVLSCGTEAKIRWLDKLATYLNIVLWLKIYEL